ncbi:unnamed protein product [Musa acuminata subsp. burmannicoides]
MQIGEISESSSNCMLDHMICISHADLIKQSVFCIIRPFAVLISLSAD